MKRVIAIIRGIGCGAAFFLGLGAGCWAIREALPFPDASLVRPKVEHFAQHHDDYDTLFLGSSRIYYQIIPAAFDRLTASAGQPTHSFNAAIAGMRPPEDAYYLDYLLRTPPKNLRWVFIELAGLRTAVDPIRAGTVRAVYWHDWERLWLLFRRALYLKPDPKKRKLMRTLGVRWDALQEFFPHLPLYVESRANVGRGSLFTAKLFPQPRKHGLPPENILGPDLAGWVKTGRPEEMSPTDLATYNETLADRHAIKAINDPSDPIAQAALEIMLTRIEKLGATPVLIVPPTTNKRNFVPGPERARKTIVLDFCDLEKFPELYTSNHRLDSDHLNTEGSEIFTRLLVQTWLEAKAARAPSPR